MMLSMMMKQVRQLVVVFNSLARWLFLAMIIKAWLWLSLLGNSQAYLFYYLFIKMTTKKNAVVKASNSKELACELSNFNYELDSMNEKSFFILTYDWTNLEKKTSGSKEKIFGLIKDKDERFDFLWFKATREMKKN